MSICDAGYECCDEYQEQIATLKARLAVEQRKYKSRVEQHEECVARLAEAEAVIKQIAHDDLEFGRLKMSAHARHLMDAFLRPTVSAPTDWQCTCGQFMSDHFDRCSNCKGLRTWTQVATASAPAAHFGAANAAWLTEQTEEFSRAKQYLKAEQARALKLLDELEALQARLAEAERLLETAVGANAMWKRLHDEAQARLAEAVEVLTQCKEKLDTYRNAWGPEYLGGVEYSVLVKRIARVTDSAPAVAVEPDYSCEWHACETPEACKEQNRCLYAAG